MLYLKGIIPLVAAENAMATNASGSQDIGISFFRDLFTSEGCTVDASLLDCIPRLLTEEDCLPITRVPDMEEIYVTLRSMPMGAAAGPNGLPLSFYLVAWDIIKEDLLALVKYFFVGGLMHKSITTSLICLIPKVESLVSFA